MATYIGGYSLPYQIPLNFSVRYNTCSLISGLGNYAVGEVFFNSSDSVHKFYYQTRANFTQAFTKAMELAKFLSDFTLDSLTRQEFDYLYNSEEYEFIANRYRLNDSEFRESLRNGTLIRRISPYNKTEKRDSEHGILTGIPYGEFYEEHISYDRNTNTVTVQFKVIGESQMRTKTFKIEACFLKCYMFAVKYNMMCEIAINKAYWRLTSGAFAAGNNCIDRTVEPIFDYDSKRQWDKLGYAHII